MNDARIKELRGRLGLSQERFARRLGVSLQTVRRWEVGLTRPLPIISLKLEELGREAGLAPPPTVGLPLAMAKQPGLTGAEVGLGAMFKGIGSFVDLVSKMAAEGKEEHAGSGEVETLGGKVRGIYGFSIGLGLGGRPVIEQFGNVRETGSGAVVAETREPLADVLDEGDHLLVVVELPGIEEGDIHLGMRGEVLEVAAATGDRKYGKEVLLPARVDPERKQTAYRNGILEVRLPKRQSA